ncbi:MAG TPA: O-antigen ligase family protein, partial [Anaerolineae bacterium]|nr:O-antigen ligase family protein [Anaerolineae bacterium]
YRAYGGYEQPNPFGGFMSLNALLAGGVWVGLLMAWWERGKWQWWRERWGRGLVVGTGVAVLLSVAVICSWSRGAWLGFAAGGGMILFFWPRRKLVGLGLVVSGVALVMGAYLAGVVPPALTERVTSIARDFQVGDVRGVDINGANYAVLERLAHWQAAFDMARDQPWLGVGFGNYEVAYEAYRLINWPAALGHAHNYYFNLLAEGGVIGLGAYLLLWAFIVGKTIYLLLFLAWPERGIALGLLGAWTTLSVHHLVDKLYVNNIYLHVAVMLALLVLLARRVEKR